MTIATAPTYFAQIGPSSRYKFITDFSQDIDLLALGGAPCRRIVLLSDGAIVTTPHEPLGGAGNQTSPALLSRDVLDVVADKIVASGTTITAALVYW